MKKIIIDKKEFEIDCNALTHVKYKSFFKTGILKDMDLIQNYIIKQTIISNQLNDENITSEEKINKISEKMLDDSDGITTDEFIIKITQIAWILIYTANKKIENYESWLESIKHFSIEDDWIVEVAEFAVNCFR